MAQQQLESFKMKTKFEGLIKLLAEGLYSEHDIFVRELIQNSYDSIVLRKELEPELAGRIEVDFDVVKKTITFSDNGIGMNRQDIREFLSVIGSTGKDAARNSGTKLSHEVIGQFGIGMLSAFVVADSVCVDTLKVGESDAFEWRNSGSEDCLLYSSDKTTVGSKITVYVGDDYTYFLSEKKLKDIIVLYCDFLSVPIYLNGIGPINTIEAPWNKVYPTTLAENDAYHDFIERRFTDSSLDVFPFSIDGSYNAKGVLYISDRHVADVNTGGFLDVFIRRMLVKKADTSLLPSWARFIRGVIDSPDLKPTAARDNIQTSDQSYEYIKRELGQIIVKRLAYLAKEQPKRFRTINEWHHYHLKGMAYFYDEFFNEVADMLLFETNRGMMSLHDYLPKNEPMADGRLPLYYFSYYDSAAQYYRLADAKNIVVINAGDRFDEEVLEKYAKKYESKVTLQQFDTLSDGVLFEDISNEESLRYSELEQAFTFALNRQGLNVKVEAKKFIPHAVPAVIVESKRNKAQEQLRSLLSNPKIRMGMEDTWDEIMNDSKNKARKLVINIDNPVISGMLNFSGYNDRDIMDQMLIAVYNNAMLYAHRLHSDDMNIVHDSIVRLMYRAVDMHFKQNELTEKLEESRRRAAESVQTAELPDYVRVFMITPFASEFNSVENAVRLVFENSPFFFQVRLARDFTHKTGGLVSNTRQHIAESHSFVADITGNNPNVMMELGAIAMREDTRPVVVLKADDDDSKVPVDLGDKLRVHYGSNSDSAEDIAAAIRENLLDGETLKNEDMKLLMRQRKARFLSKTLLKALPLNLTDGDISNITGKYETVEALLSENSQNLTERLGLKKYVVDGLVEELKGVIDE